MGERVNPTQARARQRLLRALSELEAERALCRHFNSEPMGAVEAVHDAEGWNYRTTYRCLACGAWFQEAHHQSMARQGDAVV